MSKILAQGMITLTQLYEGVQVILTPTAVLIPCDSEENPKPNAYINASTNVKAFLGTMDITSGITLGELEYSDSTVRASKTGTKVSITTITTRTGYVDIPVSATINGETIDLGKHRFNFVKQIDGQTGQPGAPGFSYTLNIKGGTRGVAYAANGTNPEPNTSSQFSVELLKNGVKVANPASISWTCGGNLSGSSSTATFTPTIKSTYASGSSYVKVSVKEFAASLAVEETIPIVCTKHADGLDWINEWNNQYVQVGTEKIITPKIFAGTKSSANELTGVAIGRDVLGGNANKVIGIVGYKKNIPVFSLDQDANFFVSSSGSAGDIKNGTNNAKGIYFDGSNLYVSGKVKISGGSTIGESNTSVEEVINNSNLGAQANNKIDNLSIGGRNLWIIKNLVSANISSGTTNGELNPNAETQHQTMSTLTELNGAKYITVQLWNPNKISNASNSNRIAFFDNNKNFISISSNTPKPDGTSYKKQIFDVPSNAVYMRIGMICGDTSYNESIKIKVELGNQATDWTPAPEDTQANIDNKANSTDVYKKTETYSKTQTDSAIEVAKDEINLGVSSTYETKTNVDSKINTAVTNIQIGGRNLMPNTNFHDGTKGWGVWNGANSMSIVSGRSSSMKALQLVLANQSGSGYSTPLVSCVGGKSYTVSFWFKSTIACKIGDLLKFRNANGNESNPIEAIYISVPANTWTYYSRTFTAPSSAVSMYTTPRIESAVGTPTVQLTEYQLEEGTKATSWTPAPEDINSAIDKKANSTDVYTKSETYTKAQTDSAIKVAKDEINLGVSNTYETKSNVETKVNNAVNNIQIGGRNLALGTGKAIGDVSKGGNGSPYSATDLFSGITAIKTSSAWTGRYFNLKAIAQRGGFKAGDNLILSVYIKADQNVTLNVTCHRTKGTGNTAGSNKTYTNFTVTPKWQQVWFPFVADEGSLNREDTRIEVNVTTGNNNIHWAGWKLEKGTKPSDWTPAPEDIDSAIGAKANSTDVYTKSQVYTKEETNSQIKVAKDEINLGVSSTYETKTNVETKVNNAVNNIQVGGVNRLAGTATSKNTNVNVPTSYVTFDPYTTPNKQTLEALGFKVGDKVTISFDWSISQNGSNAYTYGNFRLEFKGIKADGTDNQYVGLIKNPVATFSSSNKKGSEAITITLNSDTVRAHTLRFRIDNSVLNFKVSNVKLEKGNKPTTWSPAPEDVQANIDKKANSTDVYTKSQVYTKEETNSQINVAKNDITLSVSNTYETKTNVENKVNNAVNSIQIGGRNLFLNSGFTKGLNYWYSYKSSNIQAVTDSSALSGYAVKFTSTGGGIYQRKGGTSSVSTNYPNGSIMTVSGYVKSSVANKVLKLNFENAGATNTSKNTTCTNANTWYYFTHTCKVTRNDFSTVTFYGDSGADYYLKDVILEYGNKASTWTPAPEDVQGLIDSKANTTDVYKKTETYTKSETNSQIKVAKDEINLGVSNTYETKSNVETKINSIQVGGRNLAIGTSDSWKSASGFSGATNYCVFSHVVNIKTLSVGDKLTVSFRFKCENLTNNNTARNIKIQGSGDVTGWNSGVFNTYNVPLDYSKPTQEIKVNYTFTINENHLKNSKWNINFRTDYITGGTIYLKELLVEKGTKASSWTPAPEDIDSAIETKANSNDVYKKTEVYTKTETNSQITATTNAITSRVSSLESTTSSLNGTITNHENRLRTAENKITDSAIINTVSSTIQGAKNEAINSANSSTDNKLQSYATNSSLTQTSNNITAKFESSGGSNLIKNGAFKNGTAYWTKWGSPSTYQVQNSSNGYGQELRIVTTGKDQGASQTIDGLRTGVAHTVVADVWVSSGSCIIYIVDGGTWRLSSVSSGTGWKKLRITFTPSNSSVTLRIGRGTEGANGDYRFTGIRMYEGEAIQAWTPHHSEVYNGSTVIDATGVTVNNGALRVKNKAGNTVLSGDSNGNLTLAGNITSSATIKGGTIQGGTITGETSINIQDSGGIVKTEMLNGRFRIYREDSNVIQYFSATPSGIVLRDTAQSGNTDMGFGFSGIWVGTDTSTTEIMAIDKVGNTTFGGVNGYGNSTFRNNLTVSKTATFNGTTNTKAINASGAISTTGALTVGGTTTLNGTTNTKAINATGDIATSSVFKITNSPSNYSRMGYHTTDKCTFISNGSNNWLRLCDDGKLTWKGNPIQVYTKIKNTAHYGLNTDGNEGGWVRTPVSGLIPNVPNGSNSHGGSSLGTADWRFSHIYGTNLNLNGTATISGDIKGSGRVTLKGKGSFGVGDTDVYLHNPTAEKYLQFKNNGTLCISGKIIGDPSFPVINAKGGNWYGRVAPVGSDGVMEIGRYIDFHNSNGSTADYTYRLDNNGSTLFHSGSLSQGSDRSLKENIVYIDDIIETYSEPEATTLSLDECESVKTLTPFKDFIKDFRPATFNYLNSEQRNFGFIAQDVYDSKIGKLFVAEYERPIINKGEKSLEASDKEPETETILTFDLSGFTTVVAKALKEEIETRDIQIKHLENKIEQLEEMIKEVVK